MKIIMDLREVDQLQARWDDPAMVGPPMVTFFKSSGVHIASVARPLAPHDRGGLRRSITEKVDTAMPPQHVKVGSNLVYAPYMEYGTGLFAEGKGAKGGRHYPPGAALNVWAKRHGFGENAGAFVAKIIGRRGGLKPRRYLRKALADSLGQVSIYMGHLASDIAKKMAGK
jgi:hypothetical protein